MVVVATLIGLVELLSIAIVAVGGNIVTAIHTERVLSIGKSIQFCGAADSLTIAAVLLTKMLYSQLIFLPQRSIKYYLDGRPHTAV